MKKFSSCLVLILVAAWVFPAAAGKDFPEMKVNNRIDELVYTNLKKQGIPPSEPCVDEVFMRRVYLDVIGTIPRPYEVRKFLESDAPGKRKKLIEELLERDEYADYWSLKWCDLLKVKAEFPSNLWPNAVQAYHRWVRDALKNNMPYDQFASELLLASGSNFRTPQVNFYRAIPTREPESMAKVSALLFMGMRPDAFTEDELLGMAAFFEFVGYKKTAEWKEEVVFTDPTKKFLHPETKEPVPLRLPDGTVKKRQQGRDPREMYVEWLVAPDNEYFARNIVNRIWFWLLGRGIIHEADDIRPGNPPSNPALLDFLEKELVSSGYDLQHIYRLILNSQTYQLSSKHTPENLGDTVHFSHYQTRRLDAEVLIDAICQITGSRESYSSAIPEPFTFIPNNQRSITLADGSITSSFLDMFGRPPRDTGYESERNNDPSSSQMLHLLNSSHIYNKIAYSPLLGGTGKQPAAKNTYKNKSKKNKGKNFKKSKAASRAMNVDPDVFTTKAYLTVLSRFPTDEEKEIAVGYIQESKDGKRNAAIDLVWALINSKEFIYRH